MSNGNEQGPIDVSGRPDAGGGAAEPRTVDADRGLGWWTEGWALFMRSALLWVALGLILLVGLMVLGFVPILGTFAVSLLMPVFAGSWMLAARKVHDGGALEVGDLFGGFQAPHFTPLLVLGALLLAATVVIAGVAIMFGAGAVFGTMMGGMHRSSGAMMAGLGAAFVVLAIVLVLGVIVTMALWFAPALVVFRTVPPVEAMKLSATAVLQNWLPFLVFGVIYLVASIVASIPFGLGWLVLLPLSLLTVFVSYRDVFEP